MSKILILGCNGMIGSTVLRVLAQNKDWEVTGSVRKTNKPPIPDTSHVKWMYGAELTNQDHLAQLMNAVKPDVIVNCAGLTKHLPMGNDPIAALSINALLPHRLAKLCELTSTRLIHISTDCVFSGKKGNYLEDDYPDATDIYGKTKHLGEVIAPGALTLRTSTIGHELGTRFGLLEWFLSQDSCKGYRNAIFSGLPTLEFAKVLRDVVIPNSKLEGLYHVAAQPINKDALLRLIAKVYQKDVEIQTDEQFSINRSLSSEKFLKATGYRAPDWYEMIEAMHQDKI